MRARIPTAKRVKHLEQLWVRGHQIAEQEVYASVDLENVASRTQKWTEEGGEWIQHNISPVEAERFRHPVALTMLYLRSFDHEHAALKAEIRNQLDTVIRLRDEQHQALRRAARG